MASQSERKCICGCGEDKHVFDRGESICANSQCPCRQFYLWETTLSDPYGNCHRITNVNHFVQAHADMFNPHDLEKKQCPSDLDRGRTYCNATAGLLKVVEESCEQWKGWVLVIKPKTFLK